MTYQPFLAEAAGGSLEPRHVIAPLPRVLRHTRVLTGKIVSIDHASRRAVFAPAGGPERVLRYDVLVMAAGSVSRVTSSPSRAAASSSPTGTPTPGRSPGSATTRV